MVVGRLRAAGHLSMIFSWRKSRPHCPSLCQWSASERPERLCESAALSNICSNFLQCKGSRSVPGRERLLVPRFAIMIYTYLRQVSTWCEYMHMFQVMQGSGVGTARASTMQCRCRIYDTNDHSGSDSEWWTVVIMFMLLLWS